MLTNRFINVKNGLRAALAVGLATWLSHYFDVAYGYWMVLTVTVVIQPSIGATIQRAKLRTLSTLFGVLLGAFLITLIRHQPIVVMVVVSLLLFLTLWLMIIDYFYAIFFGSAALIILLGLHSENVWLFVQGRFFDTLFGVAIGLLFALLLWPSWAKRRLRQNILLTLQQTRELADLVLQGLVNNEQLQLKQVNELKLSLGQTLEGNQQVLAETNYEDLAWTRRSQAIRAMLRSLERIRDVLFALHGMQCAGVNFAEKQQVINFLCRYQKSVDGYFARFIAELGNDEAVEELSPLVLACHELHRVDDHYSTLYLRRNLDRIIYELTFFQQAIEQL